MVRCRIKKWKKIFLWEFIHTLKYEFFNIAKRCKNFTGEIYEKKKIKTEKDKFRKKAGANRYF